jgi:HEAT repeat protein
MTDEQQRIDVSGRPPLVSRLRDGDPGVRLEALAECLMLERLSPGEAMPLSESLLDPEPSTRILAVEALLRCGEDGVAPLISALHADQPTAVRAAAASALGRLSPPAVDAAGPLAACMESDDAVLRFHAASALGKMGEGAVPFLQPLIHKPIQDVALAALSALSSIGPEASGALEELKTLEESAPSPRVGLACCAARARITGEPAVLLEPSAALLASEDPQLRADCLQRMADLGEAAAAELEAILGGLSDPVASVRATAAITLARIQADPVQVVPLLSERLDDSEPEVREAAVMALAHYGPHAASALPRLREMEAEEEAPLQAMARAAAEKIDEGTG